MASVGSISRNQFRVGAMRSANHRVAGHPPDTMAATRFYDNVGKARVRPQASREPECRRNRFAQTFGIERLDQEAVHAGGERGVAIFRVGIGGERQNARGLGAAFGFGGADAARGFKPVHHRHLHVHQQQIVRRARGARGRPGFNRRSAVARDGRAMAELGQQRAHQQRIDLVVLRHQDREALGRRGALFRFRSQASAGACSKASPSRKRAASEDARTGLTR